MPLVSVIIAAYCAEATLARAVDSLLAQTMTDWEAIIVDDASTDGTVKVAEKLATSDSRIRIIRLERNGGPAAARNTGMAQALGNWIAILDADDAYMPTRLEKLLATASSNDWDLLFDNITSLSSGSLQHPYWPKWKNKNREIALAEMLRGCSGTIQKPYGILKPFIKRLFIERTALSYDEGLKRGEDVLFHVSMMLQGARTARVSEIGYLYDHPDSGYEANASLRNLQDSYIATLKIKYVGWRRMKWSEKFWLYIRFFNTTEPEIWRGFTNALKQKRAWQATRIGVCHSSVFKKLLIAKPLKTLLSFWQ